MIIQNLTPQEADRVESFLGIMAAANPNLTWSKFAQEALQMHTEARNPKGVTGINEADVALFLGDDYLSPVERRLHSIEEKLDKLLTRLDLIFGDHALVNGRFVHIADMHHG